MKNIDPRRIIALTIAALALIFLPGSAGSAPVGAWESLGPEGGRVDAVAVSPAYAVDETVFIGTAGGIYKSTDGAGNWTKLAGINASGISEVILSPAYSTDRTLFVPAGGGLHVSRDGGQTWRRLTGAGLHVSAAVSPNYEKDKTIFVGSLDRGMIKSTDGGENWTSLKIMGGNQIQAMAVSPNYAVDKTIFVARTYAGLGSGYGNGFFKSENGGKTWRQLRFARHLPITSVAFSPNYSVDKTLFAAAATDLFRSVNAGRAWTRLRRLSYMDRIAEVVPSPDYANDKRLYFTKIAGDHFSGLFSSPDAGQTWRRSFSDYSVTAVAFSPDYQADATMFVGTTEGLVKSTNRGKTWRRANTGLSALNIGSMVFSPNFTVDQVVFAAGDTGIYTSSNAGRSWTRVKAVRPGVTKPSVALSPRYQRDHMVLVGDSRAIYKSSDSGRRWTRLKIGPIDSRDARAMPVAFSPNFAVDHTMLAAIPSAGVWLKSTNRGRSWQKHKINGGWSDVNSIVFSPRYAVDRTIFASGSRHLYRSNDAGRRWRLIFKLTEATFGRPAVSPNYAADRTILLPVGEDSPQGPFISTDRGNSWRRARRGLPGTRSQKAAFSPTYADDQTMFIATDAARAGVYRSTDRGRRWHIIGTGLENITVESINPSPNYAADKTIFAGTRGSGVMAYTLTD